MIKSLKAKLRILFISPLARRFPRLSFLYRTICEQMDFMKEPIVTSWGFKLAGNKDMANGDFEITETKLVRDFLQNVDILINVGANIGYYCCHALSMGKPVIAFEPVERNVHYLYKNIIANGWSDVEIYPIALSNKVGLLKIFGGNTGASLVKGWAGTPESHVSLVSSSTMDFVLGTRLEGKRSLILVDIEGAEKWMLEGATKLLNNNPKPIWMVEIVTKQHQPSGVEINPNFLETFQLFLLNGYKAFCIDKEMRPILIEEIELVSKGILELDTYNFLFRG
jgi:FkbM family methyltransferase